MLIVKDILTDDEFIYIEVYSGSEPDSIYLVLALRPTIYRNPSDDISAKVLGKIAKIPYIDSNPDYAQEWVENNISTYSANSKFLTSL